MPQDPRTALVTGAARGIGAAIAGRLGRRGCAVICVDVDEAALTEAVATLRRDGVSAEACALDLADPDTLRHLADTLRHLADRAWPADRLDVLINAAGVIDPTPTARFDPDRYRHVLAVNLDAAVRLTLALADRLAASPAGRVLNIASIHGFRAAEDSLAYAVSKGGLINATRALAIDLAGRGILVNALAPGFVDTAMARLPDGSKEYDTDWFRSIYLEHRRLPLGRPAQPEEVAAAAEFFVSPDNSYVTGQVLAVDGGLTATF